MGTWNVKPFGNDTAGDWLWKLEKAKDESVLNAALGANAEADEAIAAAAVIEAARRQPIGKLPPKAKAWVSERGFVPSDALVERAIAAVEKIKTRSELRELWAESGSLTKWLKEMDSLLSGLREIQSLPPPLRESGIPSTSSPLQETQPPMRKACIAASVDGKLLCDFVSRGDIDGWNTLIRHRGDKNIMNLARLRLRNVALKGICLAGADLSGAELVGCDFENADFSGANVSEANLVKSQFKRALFAESKAMMSRFDRIELSSSNFVKADLRDASFIAASAQKVDFSGANLVGANFQGANLRSAKFKNSILCDADLRLADFDNALLLNADLRDAKLAGARLKSSTLEKINLVGTGYSVDDLKAGVNCTRTLYKDF